MPSEPEKAPSNGNFKAVIVGGSIAGLTIAHALSHRGIDFVVLEAHKDIAPCVGASICLLPNGSRILDQLGLYDEILQFSPEYFWQRLWRDDGRLLSESNAIKLLEPRLGYPMTFIERQRLLRVLFDGLKDKSRVLVDKRVMTIDHSSTGVTVKCSDGSSYSGDIAVGADGVHSVARREMWRNIEKAELNKSLDKERSLMTARYSAVFGMSNPTSGLNEGDYNRTFAQGFSFLIVVGKGGRVYWFVFVDMGETYREPNIPKMDQSQVSSHLAPFMDKHVNDTVLFSQVYENVFRCSHVCLEEAMFNHWTWGRLACIGDSAHKMTPNLGQGGNGAIDSAASLANTIASMASEKQGKKLSTANISSHLSAWEKIRRQRMEPIGTSANQFTRLEAFASVFDKAFALFLGSQCPDSSGDILCDMAVGGDHISFLPLPPRSLKVTMPFNTKYGLGAPGTILTRLARIFPLILGLVVYVLSENHKNSSLSAFHLLVAPATGRSNANTHMFVTEYRQLSSPNGTYTHEKELGISESASYLGDLAVFQAIWIIESFRLGNGMAFMGFFYLPFALLSHTKWGFGVAAPVYFILYYLSSPVSDYFPSDRRMVRLSSVKALMPALLVGYYLPAFFLAEHSLFGMEEEQQQYCFLLLPIFLRLVHWAISSCIDDTTSAERLYNPTADMLYIRATYALTVVASGAHLLRRWMLLGSEVLTSQNSSPHLAATWTGVMSGFNSFHALQPFQKLAFISALYWVMLNLRDLKQEKKLHLSWLGIISSLSLATVLLGPTAGFALGWALREEVLAGI